MEKRIPVHGWKKIYDIVMEQSLWGISRRVAARDESGGQEDLCRLGFQRGPALSGGGENRVGLLQETTALFFPAGEENKNLNTVKDLYETLILKQFDRHDYLLALGGGVMGDLCGLCGPLRI